MTAMHNANIQHAKTEAQMVKLRIVLEAGRQERGDRYTTATGLKLDEIFELISICAPNHPSPFMTLC